MLVSQSEAEGVAKQGPPAVGIHVDSVMSVGAVLVCNERVSVTVVMGEFIVLKTERERDVLVGFARNYEN